MTQDILDTGKEIFESLERLRGKRDDERMKLANLLELIGHIVKDTVDKLRLGQLPSGKGLQLEMLSEELYFSLAFSLGEIKAKTLANKLRNGYWAGQPNTAVANQHSPGDLSQLDAAAGYFLVTSRQLRADQASDTFKVSDAYRRTNF